LFLKGNAVPEGARKIFEELRNLPCPHYDDIAELENDQMGAGNNIRQDACCLGGQCDCPDDCPVITVLLAYIPWKREMVQEEMDDREMVRRRYGGRGDHYQDCEDDEEDGERATGSGFVAEITMFGTHMVQGEIYEIQLKDNGWFNGIFHHYDEVADQVVSWAGNVSSRINVNDIANIIPATKNDRQYEYITTIKGVQMKTGEFYRIFETDGNTYVGEFDRLNVNNKYILMCEGQNLSHMIRIDSIGHVELLDDKEKVEPAEVVESTG